MELRATAYEALPGWEPGELLGNWRVFRSSCRATVESVEPLRVGRAPNAALLEIFRAALQTVEGLQTVESFFRTSFQPFEVLPSGAGGGFLTGYYEPLLEASLTPTREFSVPLLSRPDDLVDVRGIEIEGWDRRLDCARRDEAGALQPYPDRRAIEAGEIAERCTPVAWVRDHVEVFFAQVQGSARLLLADGRTARLVYAGRNGRPYTSIGRVLIGSGQIAAEEMSLARCKAWLRDHGQGSGEAGRRIMQLNESYVFFRLETDLDPEGGPIGAQALPLTPLRSLAVDRTVWPYGLPVWLFADLSSAGLGSGPTGRLTTAQDTGSAIVGPARGDLYVGSGPQAGDVAGLIRHPARFFAFLPKRA